jgi:NADH-quinone oxidoreductase subunit E
MVNWEFFDNQTPESARDLTDRLRAGESVTPTRGASSVCTFKQMSRVLAGFNDGRANEGVAAGPATLEGLRLAQERGWTAPGSDRRRQRGAQSAQELGPVTGSAESTARGGVTSSRDIPPASPASDRGGTTAGKPPADATDGTADSGRATTPRPQTPEGAARKDDTPGDGAEG